MTGPLARRGALQIRREIACLIAKSTKAASGKSPILSAACALVGVDQTGDGDALADEGADVVVSPDAPILSERRLRGRSRAASEAGSAS